MRDPRMLRLSFMLLCAAVYGHVTGCAFVDKATLTDLGLGAVTSVAEERSFYSTADDFAIQSEIRSQFSDESLFLHVSTDVYQQWVLLTGGVTDMQARQRAEDLARSVKGSRRVINEIQVTPESDPNMVINDFLLEKKLRLDLILTNEVRSINYRWRIVNGTVYLLGLARDQQELSQVIAVAREMPGVHDIVSYAEIKE
jgi:osmotically-inducible protein OsmY